MRLDLTEIIALTDGIVQAVCKSLYSQHMNVHTGAKPFKCDMCDFACAARANLYSHKKNMHQKVPESFELSLEHLQP